ncbi:MAG: enoyl-CoA hydratase/isomerase family protein [Pseudonocardiaceae bacterium]|nr:enoyl-CoA hydratase/isomerase family protein [Pseudonocardiaceae bacterium]
MTGQPLHVQSTGPVATVRIDRPEVHNALNATVLDALGAAMSEFAQDGRTRVVVLTGAGEKAFSAGADLDELAELDPVAAHDTLRFGQRLFRDLETAGLPVIAAVNGFALGGGFELALASTFAVAAEHASFGLPEAGLGLIPGYGGTQRLARLAGRQAAAHVMLTGQRLSAQRAYELGLLAVPPVPAERLLETATELAERVAARSPKAIGMIMTALNHGADASLEAALALESAFAGLATGTADAEEGIAAFRAKRQANFGDAR